MLNIKPDSFTKLSDLIDFYLEYRQYDINLELVRKLLDNFNYEHLIRYYKTINENKLDINFFKYYKDEPYCLKFIFMYCSIFNLSILNTFCLEFISYLIKNLEFFKHFGRLCIKYNKQEMKPILLDSININIIHFDVLIDYYTKFNIKNPDYNILKSKITDKFKIRKFFNYCYSVRLHEIDENFLFHIILQNKKSFNYLIDLYQKLECKDFNRNVIFTFGKKNYKNLFIVINYLESIDTLPILDLFNKNNLNDDILYSFNDAIRMEFISKILSFHKIDENFTSHMINHICFINLNLVPDFLNRGHIIKRDLLISYLNLNICNILYLNLNLIDDNLLTEIIPIIPDNYFHEFKLDDIKFLINILTKYIKGYGKEYILELADKLTYEHEKELLITIINFIPTKKCARIL